MACILLTDMEPPTTSPTAPHNDLLPALHPDCTLQPKEELSAACLSVHLYHQVKDGAKGSESALSFPAGQYVAEELCVSAAKACGEFQEELSICSSSDRLRAPPPLSRKLLPESALRRIFCSLDSS